METSSGHEIGLLSTFLSFIGYLSKPVGHSYAYIAPVALFTFLTVIFGTQCWASRPKIPFALEDEFPRRRDRVQQYVENCRNVLLKGYSKFKDGIFGIDTPLGFNIVLPIRFMDELKSNPNLSFGAALDEFTLRRYTRVGALPSWAISLFSAKFNPVLDSYAELFQTIIREHVASLLPSHPAQEWTSINAWSSVLPLITKANVRAFLGADAAEDEIFLGVASTYIINQIIYSIGAKNCPSFLLPVVHRLLPGFSGLVEQYGMGEQVVLAQMKKKKANGLESLSDPQSVFDIVNEDGRYLNDLSLQMDIQMPLCAASIHTTTTTIVQCLYDLASRPEYHAALQQEVQEITNEHGSTITRRIAAKLEKLDSFIKEVQRFCSPDLTTFQRKATAPVTLSNGFHLPKGTRIEVATGAINADATLYDNPSEFDGLRFYKKRQTEESRSRYQVLSVSKTDLVWGYGRAACPGRFLADLQIKMVLAEILKRYDIKMPPGVARYENNEMQGQTLPTEMGEILIRERGISG